MATTQSQGKRRKPATTPATNGSDGSPTNESGAKLDKDTLVALYQKMVQIRLFEEAAQRGFRQGKVGGYLHVYIGQEAVATGFLDTFQQGDKVITAYRDHAHALLLGADPNAVMAELYGKGTGLVKGKGGSMHLFDVEQRLHGRLRHRRRAHPAGRRHGLRAAPTRGRDGIVQLYLGDGAIHNGAFHEAANLAGLWGKDGLNPCLFMLENNQYGMGTSVERATANTDLGSKFESYGIEHEKVDGMDLEAVIEVRRSAPTDGARNRQAVRDRSDHLPDRAARRRRLPGEVPLQGRSARSGASATRSGSSSTGLIEAGVTRRRSRTIRAEAKAIVDEAVRFAEESPEPDARGTLHRCLCRRPCRWRRAGLAACR